MYNFSVMKLVINQVIILNVYTNKNSLMQYFNASAVRHLMICKKSYKKIRRHPRMRVRMNTSLSHQPLVHFQMRKSPYNCRAKHYLKSLLKLLPDAE